MALPSVPTVQVRHTFLNLDGSPATGVLLARPSVDLVSSSGDWQAVRDEPLVAPLDPNGSVSLDLAANDAEALNVQGFAWHLEAVVSGGNRRTWSLLLPSSLATSGVDLADVTNPLLTRPRYVEPVLVPVTGAASDPQVGMTTASLPIPFGPSLRLYAPDGSEYAFGTTSNGVPTWGNGGIQILPGEGGSSPDQYDNPGGQVLFCITGQTLAIDVPIWVGEPGTFALMFNLTDPATVTLADDGTVEASISEPSLTGTAVARVVSGLTLDPGWNTVRIRVETTSAFVLGALSLHRLPA